MQCLPADKLAFLPVHIVPDKCVPDIRCMAAYLVRSSCFKDEPAQCEPARAFHNTKGSCGILPVAADAPPDDRFAFPCDRCTYPSAAAGNAADDAKVGLFAAFMLSVAAVPVLGDDNAAAGIFIEPVDAAECGSRAVVGKEI